MLRTCLTSVHNYNNHIPASLRFRYTNQAAIQIETPGSPVPSILTTVVLAIMAKKPVVAAPSKPTAQTTGTPATTTSAQTPSKPVSTTTNPTLSNKSSAQDVALHVWQKYLNDTPSRTLLLDVFMLFLVLVGAIQFLYCLIVGNYVSS